MARVEVSIFLTAALVFGLGCGVARQVTPNSPTPPPQVAEAQSLYDYVITNELYYDYKSPQRRSLECFAIDADANVQVIANCPGEISGNDYVPDIVHVRGDRMFFASSSTRKLTTYAISPSSLTGLYNDFYSSLPTGSAGSMSTSSDSHFLYMVVGSSKVIGFHLAPSGGFTFFPVRDFAEGSELGDEPAVQTIYITNDGRSAFVVFYPGLPSSPFSFAPFARDAITGQLLERQQASVISPRASGFTLYAEGRYALTCGDDWSARASYRVNDDGTVTRIGPGIDGCYRPQSDPLGRFVFVQTNAPGPPPSSLDTYKINADDGTVSKAAELQMNLSNCCTAWKISQTGRYFLISNSSIFNQSPGSFSVYSIDQHTGALTYKTSVATKWRVTQFETGSGSWR